MGMKHASLVVSLAIIGFAITFAVLLGSRLDDQEVALLAGIACGVGVAVPLGIALGMYVVAPRHHERDTPAAPSIIYLPQPPASSQPGSAPYLPPVRVTSAPRSFNIIGNSGLDDE
jgi:hypothetical protein